MNNSADGKKVKHQSHALPDDERELIRYQRERSRQSKKERWIVPAVEGRLLAENRLFGRVLEPRIEGVRGAAVEHHAPGGVDIGEVRAERAALIVNQPVRGREEIDNSAGRGDENCNRP